MMRRGLKRKVDKILDNFEEEPDPYQQGLGDFQTMARKRESMRLKTQVTNDSTLPTLQTWEKSLQDQIHVEQQILEGTAKFINACKNEQQTLEASKRLQLGRLRLEMLRFDLARSKRGRGSPQNNSKMVAGNSSQLARPSYAGVSLSDIRIPLMWKRKDHFNDAGDKRKFAVFCIARIGSQIYDTRLIGSVDRSSTDITIDDVILFSRVAPHFELTIEVYARLLEDGVGFSVLSGASSSAEVGKMILATPQKICRSISRAVGKKLLESSNFMDSDEQPKKKSKVSDSLQKNSDLYFSNVGPRFEMIASATLTLEDCSDDIKSHEFYVEDIRGNTSENSAPNWGDKSNLPLFGQFCCRLAAVPYCCETPVQTGYLFVRRIEDDSKQGHPEKLWGRLVDWNLSLWCDEHEFDEGTRPVVEIPINRETCILEEEKNIILIINQVVDDSRKGVKSRGKSVSWMPSPILTKISYEIIFDKILESDADDHQLVDNYNTWLVHLLQHAADHRRWKIAATNKMPVYSPKVERKKVEAPTVSWDIPPDFQLRNSQKRKRPLRSGSFYFPRIGSLNPSIVKKNKREAQRSFRATRSKLVLRYNLAGSDISL